MNKYLVPVCDASEPACCWIETIVASSNQACQEKLMQRLVDRYDIDDADSYKEFVRNAADYDIIIGKIKDIEEL